MKFGKTTKTIHSRPRRGGTLEDDAAQIISQSVIMPRSVTLTLAVLSQPPSQAPSQADSDSGAQLDASPNLESETRPDGHRVIFRARALTQGSEGIPYGNGLLVSK